MTAPQELIAKIEKANGPSKELDFEIAKALGLTVTRRDKSQKLSKNYEYWEDQQPFTASIDSAVALVERAMPKNGGIDLFLRQGSVKAVIYESEMGDDEAVATRSTAPLALLLALLRALSAKGEG